MLQDNKNFEELLEEVLNSDTLTEVEKLGHCLHTESYHNDAGQCVSVSIKKFNSKIYLIRYIDKKCVCFSKLS